MYLPTKLANLVCCIALIALAAGTTAWGQTVSFAYVTSRGASNNVSAYSIDATTGALTPIVGSPVSAGTDPFSVAVTPVGHYLYVANYASSTTFPRSASERPGLCRQPGTSLRELVRPA
jgi:DNA-binding beta-propeller fold protein YncE